MYSSKTRTETRLFSRPRKCFDFEPGAEDINRLRFGKRRSSVETLARASNEYVRDTAAVRSKPVFLRNTDVPPVGTGFVLGERGSMSRHA